MTDPIVFPEMDPAEFAAKLARYNARGPTLRKSRRTSDYGRNLAANFDDEVARRKADAEARKRLWVVNNLPGAR
jgi:hypothetical protein